MMAGLSDGIWKAWRYQLKYMACLVKGVLETALHAAVPLIPRLIRQRESQEDSSAMLKAVVMQIGRLVIQQHSNSTMYVISPRRARAAARPCSMLMRINQPIKGANLFPVQTILACF